MKREFKRLRSVSKSYDEQGAIFFACRNFARQPKKTQDKIRRLCAAAGPEYARALLAYLTTDISWERTCMEYGLSQETLTRLRRRFYDAW